MSKLKLAEFSFADGGGGAFKAAYRLHSALRREGIQAYLHVLRKESDDPSVLSIVQHTHLGTLIPRLAPSLDQLPIKVLCRQKPLIFSTGWFGSINPIKLPEVRDADIFVLYWITLGFLGINQIGKLLDTGKPLVWRLSDMWPFTGGCHYSGNCDRFLLRCGKCPQLYSNCSNDLSWILHRAKMKRWATGNLTIVSPSRWMAAKAQSSPIFQDRSIRVIPTGVDCTLFRPIDRALARHVLNLPPNRLLVLFGATSALTDPRKGIDKIAKLFACLSAETHESDCLPGLVIFGTSQCPSAIPFSVQVYPMGVIHDEALLPLIYSACDIFIAPSREENLANSVLEAMACGLPILAYRIGGMLDAVVHGQNGLLFEITDDDGFVAGLAAMLSDNLMREKMADESRARAQARFSLIQQAHSYVDLFAEISQPK